MSGITNLPPQETSALNEKTKKCIAGYYELIERAKELAYGPENANNAVYNAFADWCATVGYKTLHLYALLPNETETVSYIANRIKEIGLHYITAVKNYYDSNHTGEIAFNTNQGKNLHEIITLIYKGGVFLFVSHQINIGINPIIDDDQDLFYPGNLEQAKELLEKLGAELKKIPKDIMESATNHSINMSTNDHPSLENLISVCNTFGPDPTVDALCKEIISKLKAIEETLKISLDDITLQLETWVNDTLNKKYKGTYTVLNIRSKLKDFKTILPKQQQ